MRTVKKTIDAWQGDQPTLTWQDTTGKGAKASPRLRPLSSSATVSSGTPVRRACSNCRYLHRSKAQRDP